MAYPYSDHGHVPERLHTAYLTGTRILDTEINEFGLWHGTGPTTAEIHVLATSGFDERVANMNGLHGARPYSTDAMCRAGQYAAQVNANGEHCARYYRVTTDSAYKTAQAPQNRRRRRTFPRHEEHRTI